MDIVKLLVDECYVCQLVCLNDILGDCGMLLFLDDLVVLFVSCKLDLFIQQMVNLLFGNYLFKNVMYIFQLFGLIYEFGLSSNFWWFDWFLMVIGMFVVDVVQNMFLYYFIFVGVMFEDVVCWIGVMVVLIGLGSL